MTLLHDLLRRWRAWRVVRSARSLVRAGEIDGIRFMSRAQAQTEHDARKAAAEAVRTNCEPVEGTKS